MPIREQVAKALFNKAGRLGQLGRLDGQIAAYDDIVAHFTQAPEPPIVEAVANALFDKRTCWASWVETMKRSGSMMT